MRIRPRVVPGFQRSNRIHPRTALVSPATGRPAGGCLAHHILERSYRRHFNLESTIANCSVGPVVSPVVWRGIRFYRLFTPIAHSDSSETTPKR